MDINSINPRFVGNLMATPAVYDEEGFGDRISLWSEKDGKTYVWTRDYFSMIKKDNPKFATAIVKLAGEWRGSLPDSKLLGNDKLDNTMQLLEYGPWITNDDETGIGLALLVEWGRFALKNKNVYENVQQQISEFVSGLEEDFDFDSDYNPFDYENLQIMWDSREDFLNSAKLFIDTKWEDVPQHDNPDDNTDIPNLKKLDYPEQPDEPDEDDFEPYGEPDDEDDFSGTSGILGGGGSRMANNLLKTLANSGAQIFGVGPGVSMGQINIPGKNDIDFDKEQPDKGKLFFIDSIHEDGTGAEICILDAYDNEVTSAQSIHIDDMSELNGANEGDYIIYDAEKNTIALANDHPFAKKMKDDWSRLTNELIAQSQGFVDPLSKNIESKNSQSSSFDKQKNWKDIPDFDPSHIKPKKKVDDDDDFDFDEDAFKQDLKSLLGDDDD